MGIERPRSGGRRTIRPGFRCSPCYSFRCAPAMDLAPTPDLVGLAACRLDTLPRKSECGVRTQGACAVWRRLRKHRAFHKPAGIGTPLLDTHPHILHVAVVRPPKLIRRVRPA